MFYARVIGNVVCTIKYKGLIGKKLLVVSGRSSEASDNFEM